MELPAAAQMDRLYRRQRHVYDFTRRYYLLGRDGLVDGLKPGRGERVLEIGCGTGRNLIRAARIYPEARLFGIDVSAAMLATAADAIARAGLGTRIAVARADATSFDPVRLFGEDRFERIFVSYSLSMIAGWRTTLRNAIAVLAPGGELHLIDFGGQHGLPAWFRTGLRRWLAWFHVTPRDDLEAELARLTDQANADLVLQRPYRGYAQYAVLRLPGRATPDPALCVASARLAGAL